VSGIIALTSPKTAQPAEKACRIDCHQKRKKSDIPQVVSFLLAVLPVDIPVPIEVAVSCFDMIGECVGILNIGRRMANRLFSPWSTVQPLDVFETAMSAITPSKRPLFKRYIGIDYSGADLPSKPLSGIRAFLAEGSKSPDPKASSGGRHWSRESLANWLLSELTRHPQTIVGIDHAFSLPEYYFTHFNLRTWLTFLKHFEARWNTREEPVRLCWTRNVSSPPYCFGEADAERESWRFRLTEKWTSSAKSVFVSGHQGAVAYSTHAGIPWIAWLRRKLPKVHFWPFDGLLPAKSASVVAEIYPSIFRNRFFSDLKTDARDAFVVCRWLQQTDQRGFLSRYFAPPITPEEKRTVAREGWILGIL
jgi:hypothetical protein